MDRIITTIFLMDGTYRDFFSDRVLPHITYLVVERLFKRYRDDTDYREQWFEYRWDDKILNLLIARAIFETQYSSNLLSMENVILSINQSKENENIE
jgi:hypothetical protein